MSLNGRVALVTGGSRGLGRAIARSLGAVGARVAVLARRGPELDAAVSDLKGRGIDALGVAADVTDSAQVEAAMAAVRERWAALDILVLNAGTWQGGGVTDTSEDLWDRLLDLNLKGAFLSLKHAVPLMIDRPGGTIVGIGSLGGWVGSAGAAAYAASKWGLRGLLESAALELKPQRIRVSMVHPHNMNTAGRAIDPASDERLKNLEPEDVASLVAWICQAPERVAVGNVTIWPLATGLKSF